jgi:trafficking protein particle complex subunit 10
MRTGNIVFVLGGGSHSALPPAFGDEDEPKEETRPYIWCYPPSNGLEARIASPRYINLDELRTLEVELGSGWNTIAQGVLRVRPATAGLRLQISDTSVIAGDLAITANHDSGNIEFADLSPDSVVRLRIPYTVEENQNMLSARLEVVYETVNGRFTYSSTNTIVSTLPVSVNVQDIFKDDVLFSRFTVSPAMLVPLQLLGCSIPSSDFYQVESSIKGPIAFDVFPKQPASILYRIQQRKGLRGRTDLKRSLRLTVEFTCLDEECLMVVKRNFTAAIEQSKFRHLSKLLCPYIVDAFRTQLSTSDMETIGLVKEVEMLPYESAQWETVLASLGEPLRSDIQVWLMQWHQVSSTCLPSLLSTSLGAYETGGLRLIQQTATAV